MLQRFILEIADPPGRMTLYDYETRQWVNEVTGAEWQAMIDQLAALEADRGEHRDANEGSPDAHSVLAASLNSSRIIQGSAFASSDHAASNMASSWRALLEETASRPMIALTASAERQPDVPKAKNSRHKLWDIPHKYHCPIIGTCLEVAELRRIGSRFAWRNQERPTDYEIHVSFVAAADERNALAQATHKLLEKKYAATVRRFSKARSAEDLLGLWAEALACGEVPGALWAIMTHPRTDMSVQALVYEDVHMLSHQIGAGQRADLKRLTETREAFARLQRDFDALHQRMRRESKARDGEIQRLTAALEARDTECIRLGAQVRELSQRLTGTGLDAQQQELARLRQEVAQWQERVSVSEQQTGTWREECRLAQAENARLNTLVQDTQAACAALERLFLQASLERCDDCARESCERRADLAGRLVLCVGGRKPLVEQYRRLVTGCNGRFEHHDGGLEDNQRRLEAMLAAADAVVCATDYVSHGAYYRTKRFCKRFDKPHVLLGSSGVAAFAQALEQVAN